MLHRLRPWIAAALALAIVGLGHAYLRRWGRGLVWLLTVVGASVVLHSVNDVEPVNPLTNPEGVPAVVLVPITVLVLLSAVDAYVLGRRDRDRARTQARTVVGGTDDRSADGPAESSSGTSDRSSGTPDRSSGSGPTTTGTERPPTRNAVPAAPEETPAVTCPHCGKETDAELDFCHWCTEPLPTAEDDGTGAVR
ncbi:zinc ribbon domain-containing protein [Halopenitus persicus]|uniref:DUF7575 domain-containing protein n=1 Tax=Halopenitus persicus TaxID=1048396 RepID=A0A1H3GDZ4_9EURY|nr:zinc ribbon domain-containing protein [Halopenitus persicus]QHS16990.1 zinc ribbon domain-containing protein [haloarchaeon 3A1-DGR]SDY01533.1 hypothetical protein SAMN05216564_102435 [Halopenitus persicus]